MENVQKGPEVNFILCYPFYHIALLRAGREKHDFLKEKKKIF